MRRAVVPSARGAPRGRSTRRALAALAWLVAGAAAACPVCVFGPGLSPAQQMINADAVLLVSPDKARWKTVEVIKGSLGAIPDGELRANDVAPAAATVVALRDPQGRWVVLGALPPAQAPWLKQVAASRGTADMSDADWRERVRFHVPNLEHPVPFVAETAYGEVARAPYGAIRAAKAQLDTGRIERWLDDPAFAVRRPLYTLLYGIAGGPAAAQRIDRQLAAAARERDATELAALLVAAMEQGGPARIGWIETAYLSDRERSAPEIQAALLALSEQGNADAAVPRARVVAAYRTFIRSRNPLAGYPAPVLAGWSAWDAVPDYVGLLASKAPQHRPRSLRY